MILQNIVLSEKNKKGKRKLLGKYAIHDSEVPSEIIILLNRNDVKTVMIHTTNRQLSIWEKV